ncbi:hypothetical protein ACWEPZ_01580 [Streptomyces sp. NPDC004288]
MGYWINRRTVTRHLNRLSLGRRGFVDPDGDSNRNPGKITARRPGCMVHLDVKKVDRTPPAADGASTAATVAKPRPPVAPSRPAHCDLHSAIDGFARLSCTEPLPDEKGATAAAFLA